MIKYNPKNWFGLIFKFHKQETFRQLFWVMISISVYTALVCVLEIEVFNLSLTSSTLVHSLLGFIISMLLVFRTNTAYDRWWEGRKHWGALVNVSRNLAIKVTELLERDKANEKINLLQLIKYFPEALKNHLRDKPSNLTWAELPNFNNARSKASHVPLEIARLMQAEIAHLKKQKYVDDAQYYAMQKDVNNFMNICGACERIKNTPIPYTYNIFIKKFIFAFIMTMPFGFVSTFGYWTIGITIFTFYALASLEIIAEEIEDPFGEDPNDLPTDNLALVIAKNIDEINSNLR